MMPQDLPDICRDCPVPHVQNCPTCFGFGIYGNPSYPIAADVAMRAAPGDLPRAIPCPVCGSGIGGSQSRSELVRVRVVANVESADGALVHVDYAYPDELTKLGVLQTIADRRTIQFEAGARRAIENDARVSIRNLVRGEQDASASGVLVRAVWFVQLCYTRAYLDAMNATRVPDGLMREAFPG